MIFNFLKVDFAHLGHNVMLRYGDYNATDSHDHRRRW